MITINTKSRTETKNFGAKVAKKIKKYAKKNDAIVIALSGNLGSGKTTFVQGFAKGLGFKEIPKSPTFILMQIFPFSKTNYQPLDFARGGQPATNLIHIDAYRLEKPKELLSLGLKEILRDPHNIVIIEWAEKVKLILPKETIWIYFKYIGANRLISIKSNQIYF